MKWSIKIAEVAGTSLWVHLTFVLLLAWIGTVLWLQEGPTAAAEGLVLVVLLFGCVVLHEFGHVFAARRYGIATRHITLLPIGGLASLDRMPEDPGQEVVVALAGPAVNFVIAGVLIGVFGAQFDLAPPASAGFTGGSLLNKLATLNIVFAVFNLLPAFPMDGGRVLRAALGFRMSRPAATRIAARIGQALAVLLGFLGLLGNPFLVLIAIFIFVVAEAESYQATMTELARGHRAADVMITSFKSLPVDANLDDASWLLLSTTQKEFPVVQPDSGQLFGFLTRTALLEHLNSSQGTDPVAAGVQRDIPTVQTSSSLDYVVELLQKQEAPAVGILDRDQNFIGYVTLENLSEFFLIESAANSRDKQKGVASSTVAGSG